MPPPLNQISEEAAVLSETELVQSTAPLAERMMVASGSNITLKDLSIVNWPLHLQLRPPSPVRKRSVSEGPRRVRRRAFT